MRPYVLKLTADRFAAHGDGFAAEVDLRQESLPAGVLCECGKVGQGWDLDLVTSGDAAVEWVELRRDKAGGVTLAGPLPVPLGGLGAAVDDLGAVWWVYQEGPDLTAPSTIYLGTRPRRQQ